MTIKTDEQVQAEITALKALQPQLPQRAQHAIDAALKVLEGRLSHDAVYELFEEGSEEFEDAFAARMWRDGTSGSAALSVLYRELI
ncbi:hypothetical protein [Cupriavidus pampae]|uniref:Uncharacterized protein n=1 Tax=Cupriavidus pampae TaxID=659251 RepID=A0ABM8XW50_9BURK|nr:hypothetical protein [Cupriavidus pampae]CAG9184613.1 hypothetical protein LMG32289_05666 [Cupriavidus pampae]